MEKKAVVIGAGMGGLSCAIRLKNQGYEVELYEKNDQPGGKMHRLTFDGHTFDVGPTLVMMPEIYKEIYVECGKNPDDYISLFPLDPMYEVYFSPDYRKYSISSDLTKLMALFEKKDEKEALGFLNYLSDIYKRYLIAKEHFITKPFRYKRDFYNPFTLYQAMKLKTFNSASAMMASYVKEKDFQQMLSFQTLYIGVSPNKGPSLYNIIPMIELMYGVWSLKGGMHAMARGLERLFLELGGVIHYHSKVDEILIKDGKTTGIRLDDQIVNADIVISDADFPYTMKHLVKEESARGKYHEKKIDSMEYSCSCLVFYWAVDRQYEHLAGHTFVVSEDLDKNLQQIFHGSLLEDPSIYLSIPSNMDRDMAPEGKSSFYLLIPVSELGVAKYEYNDENIDYYRKKALEKLKKISGLEDLQERIYGEKIFSPKEFEKDFCAFRGATFGLQPTLLQSNHLRPQSKCLSCEGLYFTGSSTHPGAGVPIALEGGKICAGEVIKDYGAK